MLCAVPVTRIFAGVARPVAGPLKAAYRLAALEKQIRQADILAAPAFDLPACARPTKVILLVIG